MPIPAGDLRQRITLQQQSTDVDGAGQPVDTWTDIASVWAKRTNTLRPTMEAVAQGVKVSSQQVRFDIRARAIDPAWRILHNGTIYAIKTIGMANENDVMAILAVSTGATA